MKRYFIILLLLLAVIACKKKPFAPEGPTDVRIRNLSDMTMQQVIITTSEKPVDTDTIATIPSGAVSEYLRFTKAYPKAQITAKININGSLVEFSTGPETFYYLTYIGQDRITFEVYISNFSTRELKINNVIQEEPLVLK